MPTVDQLLFLAANNHWQDITLSLGNIFLCFTLIPMLRHPSRPPLLTCIPTGLALLAGGVVFASLHLWFTALTQAITGMQWLGLAFKKPVNNSAGKQAIEPPVSWRDSTAQWIT
jgi:hypothetical protein